MAPSITNGVVAHEVTVAAGRISSQTDLGRRAHGLRVASGPMGDKLINKRPTLLSWVVLMRGGVR